MQILDDRLWSVPLAAGHLEVVRSLADEQDHVDGRNSLLMDAPMWSDILIDSSGSGWVVVEVRWRSGLLGSARDLAALCRSLVSTGRKREREIAGRIKVRALEAGAPAEDWDGEPPDPKPSQPRTIEDVALAWGQKIAFDYRRRISGSTSRHVGVALGHADRVVKPPIR